MAKSNNVICPYCNKVVGTMDELQKLASSVFDYNIEAHHLTGSGNKQPDFDALKRGLFDLLNRAKDYSQRDDKELEEANTWIDMKCPKCSSSYRYNSITGEARR